MQFLDTPIEQHFFSGRTLYVKREDLCAPPPMPPLSKARGIGAHLLNLREKQGVRRVGVLDTKVSKSGLAVAILAEELGLGCDYFFPAPKGEEWRLPHREEAERHGATLCPLPGGRIAVAYGRARAQEPGHMLPLGFPLFETVTETAAVVEGMQIQGEVEGLLLAVGTGTILAGVVIGLARRGGWQLPVFGVTASMDVAKAERRCQGHFERAVAEGLVDMAALNSVRLQMRLYKWGEDYYAPEQVNAPWPCHPYYEGKALAWLQQEASAPERLLFYNIGA